MIEDLVNRYHNILQNIDNIIVSPREELEDKLINNLKIQVASITNKISAALKSKDSQGSENIIAYQILI